MKWVFHFLNLMAYLYLFTDVVSAQTYGLTLPASLQNPNFLSNLNNTGNLPPGTAIKILETRKLPSGVTISKIIFFSENSLQKTAEELWIYELGPNQYKVISPFLLTPFALLDDQPIIPSLRKQIRNNTEAQVKELCAECTNPPEPGLIQKNKNDLKLISKAVEKNQNRPLKPDSLIKDLRKKVENYSNSSLVKTTIDYAIRNFGRLRARGKCYMAVKLSLAASPTKKDKAGLIPGRFPDEAALNAKNSLKEYGFINLLETEPFKYEIKNAAQAPKGSVLVYSSGKKCHHSRIKDCGHVEIKTDKGYISDFFSKDPITIDPRYKLVGVMIKPMDGSK